MKLIESALNSWPLLARWIFPLLTHLPGRRGDRASLNRALGHRPDARLLIINLDDAGLCPSTNAAVAEALQGGAATSCTVMTMTPGFEEFARMARAHPHWSVGVHLVLTSEWPSLRWGPVLDPGQVPSLVDRQGHFRPTLLESVLKGRPGEVRREWRAQIHRALDAGIQVDHLDCHMGPYHFRPDFFKMARDLARQHGLALRIVVPWRKLPSRLRGVPCADWPVIIPHRQGGRRLWRTVEDRRRQLLDRFAELRPGISFWWTHISRDTEEWRSIRPPRGDPDEEDYPGEHRDQYEERITDYQVLADPTFRRELEALGIQLVGYGPLRRLARRWAAI